MMGHRLGEQAALFYEFSLERHVPPNHLLRSIDRFVREARWAEEGAVCLLQHDRAPLDRPRADDPNAAGRLLLWHPFGAALVRRGSPQSGIPLVLPPWARG